MTKAVRVRARHLDFDFSNEEAEDLRWLVENGRRWSSCSASARAEHCRKVKDSLVKAMLTAVRAANLDVFARIEAPDWSQRDVIVEVDGRSDAAPWELLDFGHGPIGLTSRSVARESAERTPGHEHADPWPLLRVLLVTARPYGRLDVPYLAVSKHFRTLLSDAFDYIQVRVLRPPTFDSLAEMLTQTESFDVLHFDGHGDLRPEGPILVFEDNSGQPLNIRAGDFTSLAKKARLKLIVLNSCRSALASSGESAQSDGPTSQSLAYRLASQAGVPIVAMRYLVQADVAGRFVGTLYRSLLEGRAIGAAVQTGRKKLIAGSDNENSVPSADHNVEWLLPVYYSSEDELFLVRPQGPIAAGPTKQVRPVHGMDAGFLALEKAFQAKHVPIICGPIGGGKLDLAHAYAEWFQLTSGRRTDIQEISVTITDQDQRTAPNVETALAAAQQSERILILKLEVSDPLIEARSRPWLNNLLRELESAGVRSMVVWDGFPRFAGLDRPVEVLTIVEATPDALASHALDVNPNIERSALEFLISRAAGNPMFIRSLAAGEDVCKTPWFSRAASVHAASKIAPGMLACLRQFDQFLNIYALRRMMYETGNLKDPYDFFLVSDNDEQSDERKSLEKMLAGGLLVHFSPNTYVISPWLQELWSRLTPDESASKPYNLAFAKAIAETCAEYQMDYFVRGNRDAAYVIAKESANISRAWSVLQSQRDFAGLVKLLAGLAALWTLQQRFDLIEDRAQELDRQMNESSAPEPVHDSLMSVRLQAANALGRIGDISEAIRNSAERRLVEWQQAGEPRGLASFCRETLHFC